ncbi:two-component system regulatory protein YycI [Cohnella sp. REN36]|uniref:two-component system regulatory protein YycI n=1 Tax=Cohnella sp. REN36 TaxID=2887347 RepID=UPI001D150EBF|nr:two-component system regulatory protein YycI [Cohnella sp. REN36]
MDWRRAKSVLILAFLILNVVLGYQLWLEWRERIDRSVDLGSLSPEAQQAMNEKKIRITGKIPTETPRLREMTYKLQEPPSMDASARTPIDPPKETRIVFSTEELQQALGSVIPDLSKYRFDYYGSREGAYYSFNRMVDGLPFFDVRLELYYSELKIRSYRQDLMEELPSESGPEQKVLPATQAVASLILKKYLPAGANVQEVTLGYHGQPIFDSETQVSSPSWRILIEGGDIYYVNAINGEVSTDKGSAQPAQTG